MFDPKTMKQHFDEQGFAVFHALLDAQKLTEVRARLEHYKTRIAPTLETGRVMYEQSQETREIKQLADMEKVDPFFADMLHSSYYKDKMAALLGDEAIGQSVEYFNKPPGIGTPTPPHQDGYYFCLTPNEAVTVWIALDDCDEENGCLCYLRGSNRNGLIDHQASGIVGFSQGLQQTHFPQQDIAKMIVRAGDALAHHALTIHFAGPNRSPRHRRSLGMVYHAARAKKDPHAFARYQASLTAQRNKYQPGAV